MLQDETRIPPPGYRSAPERRAVESRRMMVAAGGIGAVLLLGIVGYFVASGGGPAGVPVIEAPAGPVKVKPTDPGGLQVNGQTSVLLANGGAAADANLAPAPEAPEPAALAASATHEQLSPAPAPAQAAAPSAAAPPSFSVPSAPPSAPVAAALPPPAVSVPTVPETPVRSEPQRTAMNIRPPSPGAAAVHNLAEEYNPPPAGPTGHGHVRVQLAALGSREAALHEWDHLAHRMPTFFRGRRPIFEEAHVNGHTYWRVRTTGFASIKEAAQFCDGLRAQGAACTVASF